MTYQVHLAHFEGPLDLLLHLIRRDKINIYDIPVSHITREYLSYIEIMQELKLELAGEFFVMAATLMRIKARMLLPRRLEEEEDDPREELVQNLLEYRKFKEVASQFAEKEHDRRLTFTRPSSDPPVESLEKPSIDVSIFDLVDAFKKVMEELKEQVSYRIEKEAFTIEEKVNFINDTIRSRSEVLFTELFGGRTDRMEIIVTFLAILEMIRLGDLRAKQMSDGSDIWIYRPDRSTPENVGERCQDVG
jgi:segregation and condensation protein A